MSSFISGCAGLGQNEHFAVSIRDTCCDSFETMAYQQLPANQAVRLAVDSDDPVYNFKGGFSHFEAFALPEFSEQYTFQLESEVVRDEGEQRGKIFFPVLILLDKNKKEIVTLDALPYTLQTPIFGRKHIRSSVKIADKLSNARYLIVHTQDDKLDMAISTEDGKNLFQSKGFSTMLFAPIAEPRYRIEFTDKGWIRLLAFTTKKG